MFGAFLFPVRLIIHAKFVGLKYLMYYYPATSAIVGSLFNFHVLALVVLLSWWRFLVPTTYTDGADNYEEDVSKGLDESFIDEKKIEGVQDDTDEESFIDEKKMEGVQHDTDEETEDSINRRLSDLVLIKEDNSMQLDSEEDIALNVSDNSTDSKAA